MNGIQEVSGSIPLIRQQQTVRPTPYGLVISAVQIRLSALSIAGKSMRKEVGIASFPLHGESCTIPTSLLLVVGS